MDPDQRCGQRDRLSPAADLDPPRLPRIRALNVVDHDRGSPGTGDVPELLRSLQLNAADLDRIPGRVVDPPDGDHMRRAVRANRRYPGELAPAGEIAKLGVREDTHDRVPCRPRFVFRSETARMRPPSGRAVLVIAGARVEAPSFSVVGIAVRRPASPPPARAP